MTPRPISELSPLAAVSAVLAGALAWHIVVARTPDRLARVRGYRGAPGMFALDANVWPPRERDLLAAYGEIGRREVILAHLLFDLPFLAAYTALFVGILGRNHQGLWLPLATGLADVLEDVGIVLMAWLFPREPPGLVGATAVVSVLKGGLFAATVALAVAGLRERPLDLVASGVQGPPDRAHR